MPRRCLPALMCLSGCLLAIPAIADERADAEQRFRAGVALQKVEDWDAAVVEFQASLGLYPSKAALFNLATALRATHRYAEALSALERLERDFGDDLDPQMRQAAAGLAHELRALTATLRIEVNEPGATILVDGEAVGTAPLNEPLLLGVGDHRIEAVLEGYTTSSLRINLASRDDQTHQLELRPDPPTTPAPPPSPPVAPDPAPPDPGPDPAAEPHRPLRATAWVTVGAGAALLGAGTATGIWALALNGDLKGDCIGAHCPPERGDDIDRMERLATTSTALLTAGLATTAVGATLILVDRRHQKQATRWRFVAHPGFLGTTVEGHF